MLRILFLKLYFFSCRSPPTVWKTGCRRWKATSGSCKSSCRRRATTPTPTPTPTKSRSTVAATFSTTATFLHSTTFEVVRLCKTAERRHRRSVKWRHRRWWRRKWRQRRRRRVLCVERDSGRVDSGNRTRNLRISKSTKMSRKTSKTSPNKSARSK